MVIQWLPICSVAILEHVSDTWAGALKSHFRGPSDNHDVRYVFLRWIAVQNTCYFQWKRRGMVRGWLCWLWFFLISEHYITLSHPQKILSNFCQLPALVLVEQTHQSYDLLSLSDRKTCKTTTPATFMKRPHTASKQLSCSSMYCLKSGSWKNLEEFTQNLPLPLEPDMSTIISQWNGRFRFRMTCPVTNGESYWEVCWPERWSVEISPFLFSSTRLHLKRDLQTVRELHNYI